MAPSGGFQAQDPEPVLTDEIRKKRGVGRLRAFARSAGDRIKAIAGRARGRVKVQRALHAAGRRQRVMLPAVPEVARYEFACVYRPAEQVSGDFYDIIDLGEGRYGMLVGDVSGHGLEAAVVMGSARKALQIYARSGGTPSTVLSLGNEDLGRELDRETFLTAGYAILDTGANSIRYVRAGHTYPLLMGPHPGKWHVVKSGGMMLGNARGSAFTKLLEEVELPLQAGQSFVQYSDGLVEARDRRGDAFGIDRVIEHLNGASGSEKPLVEALDGLIRELAAWSGGVAQEDDISILAVRRNA
jgi:serine phosphatase RsbU (regulator of sigma subunit)